MLNPLLDISLTDIESHIAEHPVVLFSPRSHRRNAFMTAFISSPAAYLYTLTEQETTLPVFARELVTALGCFFPKFGSQTLQALDATPYDLADALVADLKSLK